MSGIKIDAKKTIDSMFEVGAHFGYPKSRRHPSTKPFIFGTKNGVEIIDLEKTVEMFDNALNFAYETAKAGGTILFVGTKREISSFMKDSALKIDAPYVINRWIGGTITNFEEIQKRVKRLETLEEEKTKGLLAKYTKKERLLIDREIEKLNERFGGIVGMKSKPKVIFIVDSKHEENAFLEAKKEGIPVISIVNSDNDISEIDYPVVANDSSVHSVKYFVNEFIDAIKKGQADKK